MKIDSITEYNFSLFSPWSPLVIDICKRLPMFFKAEILGLVFFIMTNFDQIQRCKLFFMSMKFVVVMVRNRC